MEPQLDDDTLQRYFDGELPEPEAEQVRQALDASDSQRQRLEQLGQLRKLVRMTAEDTSADLGSEALYARIERRVRPNSPGGAARRLRVVDGGGASRRRVVATVGAALALAAAAVLAVLGPWAQDSKPVAESAQPNAGGAPAPSVIEHPPEGSEVVEVDFGGNTGTVFEVEGEAGEPVAVVWIQEEGRR
jgi:anti-sigma factor RsiW